MNRKIFSTVNNENRQAKETYFIESGDKVRYFFEEDAIGEKGELLVDPMSALNKVARVSKMISYAAPFIGNRKYNIILGRSCSSH